MRGLWLKAKFGFDHRTLRERILLGGGIIAIFIVIWYSFLLKPLESGLKPMEESIATAEKAAQQYKIQYLKSQKDIKAIPKPDFNSKIEGLKRNIADLQKQSEEVSTRVVDKKQISRLTKTILDRANGVKLVMFDALPAQALSGAEGGNESSLFKNAFDLSLTGTYYELLNFLEKIESLGINVYWDSLTVDVAKYPEMTIKLKIFILSRQKGILGEALHESV